MNPLNLFIDTGIFLNFYHYSDENLEKLTALEGLISNTNQIQLFVPSQLVDEFYRNRESKIKDALKRFEEDNISINIPKLCTGYNETENMLELLDKLKVLKRSLTERIYQDVNQKKLKADKIIRTLLSHGDIIEESIVLEAKKRFDLGNPPGKDGSYGDAINWEYLLAKVPQNEDLHFVGDDKDYRSPLDESSFSLFLKEEWQKKKKSDIHYYRKLNDFFKVKFPGIKIEDDEYLKDYLIEEFANSKNFDSARAHLAKLVGFTNFTEEQIKKIVIASVTNDQIYNAHKYSPEKIGHLLEKIINGYESIIESDLYIEFCIKFNIAPYHIRSE